MTSIPLSEFGSGPPAAKFEQIGAKYVGTITAIEKRQQTDPQTQKGKTFEDGSPMMQWVITIEQDDGESVNLWAKGGNWTAKTGSGNSMQSAIAAAVEASGAKSLDVGGSLAVAHTGLGEAKAPGLNPPKLFTAQYRPPAPASVSGTDLFGDGGREPDEEPF